MKRTSNIYCMSMTMYVYAATCIFDEELYELCFGFLFSLNCFPFSCKRYSNIKQVLCTLYTALDNNNDLCQNLL